MPNISQIIRNILNRITSIGKPGEGEQTKSRLSSWARKPKPQPTPPESGGDTAKTQTASSIH